MGRTKNNSGGGVVPKTPPPQQKKEDKELVISVYGLIEPLCAEEGIELVHIEYQREAGGRILRVYIDKPGGVTLDDCADISRQAGDILDVGLDGDAAYNLEVSSPGFDRPLVKLGDYDRFKGQGAIIKTEQPLNGQKKFKGSLLGVTDNCVNILIDNRTVAIPFDKILKARLTGE